MKSHYDKKYFNWEKSLGQFGADANYFMFEKYISSNHKIIEFGCGGGYMLKKLPGKDKIGVELNPVARKETQSLGIKAVSKTNQIPDNWADRAISINVLEHVHNPLKEIQDLYRKLKKGGIIIFVVPCENISRKYFPDDINQHLFAWSPMGLGNLFTTAGFKVKTIDPIFHKWPPYYQLIRKFGGPYLFHISALIMGRLVTDVVQVRIIATK